MLFVLLKKTFLVEESVAIYLNVEIILVIESVIKLHKDEKLKHWMMEINKLF